MEKVVRVSQVVPAPVTPVAVPAVVNNKPLLLNKNNMKKFTPFIVIALIIIAGIGTGYTLAGSNSGGNKSPSGLSMNDGDSVDEAGKDNEAYKDEAEGELKAGGFEGDGTHYLDRGMGPEKNVYLTSSVIDLESFVGKKVKVWVNQLLLKKPHG